MEVALRLLQLLADPSEVLERADRPGGLGAAHLSSVLHNTVFKVGQYLQRRCACTEQTSSPQDAPCLQLVSGAVGREQSYRSCCNIRSP